MSERDTIPATCARCGRPSACASVECYDVEHCHRPNNECRVVAAAYRRGIDEGVKLAKEYAEIERYTFRIVPTILWEGVDAAAAAAKGEP